MRAFGDPLRVALVGCGDIAPAHARALQKAARAKLVVCVDVVEASAKSLSEEFGIPASTNLEEVLADPALDLVTVATPAFTRLAIVRAAAAAGKAVLAEKPIATNLDDADDMLDACEEAGVPFSTCFPVRYLGAAKWARELIDSGALGRIAGIWMRNFGEKQESYWTGGYSGRTATDWRKSKSRSGGGVIITNLVHHIDAARAISGLEAARAWCESGTFATDAEVEDLAIATLRYENDAIGLVDGSSIYWGGDGGPWQLVFLGTKGQVRFAFWGGKAEAYLTEPAAGLPAREWVKREFQDQTLVDLYDDLAAALQAGEEPPCTGEDGRAALEIVLAIYRAAGTGQPVLFPLDD